VGIGSSPVNSPSLLNIFVKLRLWRPRGFTHYSQFQFEVGRVVTIWGRRVELTTACVVS
jgi:hypothetical protein